MNNDYSNPEKLKDYFQITEMLFGCNDISSISQLIDTYRENKNDIGEFKDTHFPCARIPMNMVDLTLMTELIISKTNLEAINTLPPSLKRLIITESQLAHVDCGNFPDSITHVDLTHNKIHKITNINKNIKALILDKNNLSNIIFPPSMEIDKLSLKENKFKNLDFMKNIVYLRELDVLGNDIQNIDELIDSIEFLSISKNYLTEINSLPKSLIEIIAYGNKISRINCKFPDNVRKMDFYNNNFRTFPDLTETIKWIDLSCNELEKIPRNFTHLEFIDISNNGSLDIDSNQDLKLFLECSLKNKHFKIDNIDSFDDYIQNSANTSDDNNSGIYTFDNIDDDDGSSWTDDLKNINFSKDNPIHQTRYVKFTETYII